jgi:hypothetical protein
MTAYKMVPTVATAEMLRAGAVAEGGLVATIDAAIAAAPPFVVTDAMERAAANAMFCHRETPVTLGEMMRAAIEAAIKEAGRE